MSSETRKEGGTAPLAPAARACPICGKPAVAPFDPFCSKRCGDVDLHKWLGGSYAIPVIEDAPTIAPADEET